MRTLFQDLRYGMRMMAKSPVVTAVAVLSLSLGIAANASMFSILNSFLLEPLPYEDQEELVLLREVIPDRALACADHGCCGSHVHPSAPRERRGAVGSVERVTSND